MGTWGYHSFENDVALDWLGGALGARGVSAISDALDAALNDDADMLDADTAQTGIAAVEALAIALGRPRGEGDPAIAVFPKIVPDAQADLVQRANHAIMRITGASELRALWEEASWDEREAWIGALTDLRTRINGEVPVAKTAFKPSQALTTEQALEDIRLAVSGLEAQLVNVRADVMEGLARISRKVEALNR